MLRTLVCALLVFAVSLVTVAPPRIFAQTLVQPATSTFELDRAASPATPKSDLRKSLADEMARIKAGRLSDADVRRPGKEQQNQQSGAPTSGAWTRKNTIFLGLFIVVMTGLVVVLIKHHCRDPRPCPEIDSTDYSSDY